MALNKQSGNMYPWVNATWNPIKGKCPHECIYCYMNRFPQGELRLDEKCLKDNLGEGNTIFVGSSTDMWSRMIHGSWDEWVKKILAYCHIYALNRYFFQTKDVYSLIRFQSFLPPDVLIGTTTETNRPTNKISKAPPPYMRLGWLKEFPLGKMISIEPIMDFDLNVFLFMIKKTKPLFVSIGADSKGHKLPEPPAEKIKELIQELEKFTEVKIKKNLNRLLKQ